MIQVYRISNYFYIRDVTYSWYFFVKSDNMHKFTGFDVDQKMHQLYEAFGTYNKSKMFGKDMVCPLVLHRQSVIERFPYTAIRHDKDFLLLNVKGWWRTDKLYGKLYGSERIDDAYLMAIHRNIVPSDWIVTDIEGLNARWEIEHPFIARLVDISNRA